VTYEDEEEAKFLIQTFFPGSGVLRNVAMCILSPDSQQRLSHMASGPNFVYPDATGMASDMHRIAKRFPGLPTFSSALPLPQIGTVPLAINVASCDGLPCVVAVGANEKEVDRLIKKLASAVWDEKLIGKFVCASTTEFGDLKTVAGAKASTGFLVIEPDRYGKKGKLITAIAANKSVDEIKASLLAAADSFKRNSKTHRSHIRFGRLYGEKWETKIPVPDSKTRRPRR
jgi:hypothetical protein